MAEDSFDDKPNTEASFEDEASFEEVEEARTRIRKREGLDKESLDGLSEDVQEALMVEDLLFVLMVCILCTQIHGLKLKHFVTGCRRELSRI